VLQSLHLQYEARLGGKTMSHDALARIVNRRLGERISDRLSLAGSTLWRWEAGEVAAPDPLILRELADIYGVPFDRLLAVLECNLREPHLTEEMGLVILGRDLLRHAGDGASNPQL